MHPPIWYPISELKERGVPEERWDRFQWLGSTRCKKERRRVLVGNKGTHLPWFSIPLGFDELADTLNVRNRVLCCNQKTRLKKEEMTYIHIQRRRK